MRTKTPKVIVDKIARPIIEGWYWYYATEEEMKELTLEWCQVCKVYVTKEGVLQAEFIREIRGVSRLMGTWSSKLTPEGL